MEVLMMVVVFALSGTFWGGEDFGASDSPVLEYASVGNRF